MQVYVGQTRGRRLIHELSTLGFGEMTQRNEVPPRRTPWVLDNGAFKDWRNGDAFDAEGFMHAVEWVAMNDARPDFIVIPDVVADRQATLDSTFRWGPRLAGIAPLYAVVQDGMTEEDIRRISYRPWLNGFFVGGTLEWKMASGSWITELCHDLGLPCHIGRCGTPKRVRWARGIGAASIDSCLPLWSRAQMNAFVLEVTHPFLWKVDTTR